LRSCEPFLRAVRDSFTGMRNLRLLTLPHLCSRISPVGVVSAAMFQGSIRTIACLAVVAGLAAPIGFSQQTTSELMPPQYRGVTAIVDGIFVTPVPGAPLTAIVEVQSTQVLADGSTLEKKSIANIARDSQGRIYNERRQLVSPTFNGQPQLLSFHIFDPETRVSTFVNPATRVARQFTLSMPIPAAESNPGSLSSSGKPPDDGEDLGMQMMESVLVHGFRKNRTVPAAASGTDKPVVVSDEYWYSDELHLNMLVKHDDPRTGQQSVSVTHLARTEPDDATFKVPAGYKIVDETPETQNPRN
jgi:hypothetical protein